MRLCNCATCTYSACTMVYGVYGSWPFLALPAFIPLCARSSGQDRFLQSRTWCAYPQISP